MNSEGLNVLDHVLGTKDFEGVYLKTCPKYASALVAYSQAQRSEHVDAKFRCVVMMEAKRLRPDMYDPKYITKHTILELRCPDYKVKTVEGFIAYAGSLFVELDGMPAE